MDINGFYNSSSEKITLSHETGNTVVRLNVERQDDNRLPKEYFFYIGARNMYGDGITPLGKISMVCPAAPVPTVTAQAFLTSGLYKDLVLQGGGGNLFWTPYVGDSVIVGCDHHHYVLVADSTNSPFVTYSHSTSCDFYNTNCNKVTLDTSA